METQETAAARTALEHAMAGTVPVAHPVPSIDELRDAIKRLNIVPHTDSEAGLEELERLPGEWFDHPVTRQRLRIGPMSQAGYEALHAVPKYHQPTGKCISIASQTRKQSDLIYLQHGILWPKLTEADAQALYDAPGCGPANIVLVNSIMRWNPAPEDTNSAVQDCLATSRFLLMVWIVMINAGLLTEFSRVLDTPDPESEDDKAKHLMIQSILKYVPWVYTSMQIEERARNLDIPLNTQDAIALLNRS